MLRVVAIASLVVPLVVPLFGGCRISLENFDTPIQDTDGGNGRACVVSSTSQPCMDATMHSDLAFIEQKIFAQSCNSPGSCHNSASDPGKLDLRPGVSHDHLVGVPSMIDRTRRQERTNLSSAIRLFVLEQIKNRKSGAIPGIS